MLRLTFSVSLCVAMLVVSGCTKESVAPTQPKAPQLVGLSAVPPVVAVGIGGVQHVNVGGGIPPYVIVQGPRPIATVDISDADSSIAILKIMGVTVDSIPTAVTVRDNTSPLPRTVSVPVTVF